MEIQLYYIIIKFLTLIFYYVIICSQSLSSALMVEYIAQASIWSWKYTDYPVYLQISLSFL